MSNRYSFSIRTHGNSRRRCASSSLRRVSSFSASSSASRAAIHSLRVPVVCVVIFFFSPLVTLVVCSVFAYHVLIRGREID